MARKSTNTPNYGNSVAAKAAAPGQIKKAAGTKTLPTQANARATQARTLPGLPGPDFTPRQLEQIQSVANAMFGQNTAAAKRGRKV